MKKILLPVILVLFSLQISSPTAASGKDGYLSCLASSTLHAIWQDYVDSDSTRDVTGKMEDLGIPYAKTFGTGEQLYARNPWDLLAFAGRLYLGAGNSSNKGPAINSGPVEVQYFDPATREFVSEARVDEEQIDLYREHGGNLYIPGHDTTQSWKLGNYYRKTPGGEWEKSRNIPGALHVYDLAWHGSRMFAALGTRKGAAVAVSADEGKSWQVQHIGRNRVYGFMKVGNKFYAMKRIPAHGQVINNEKLYGVAEFTDSGDFIPRYDIKVSSLFPSGYFLESRQKKVVHSLQYGDKTYYIGAYIHNDHQYIPFGLFAARSFDRGQLDVKRICLPMQYRPWDILEYDGYLYVLVETTGLENKRRIIKVLRRKHNDLSDWEEYFQFSAATFARSFEILDSDFYFGLGSEIKDPAHWNQKELSPSTGTILRVRGSVLVDLQ